MSAVERGLILAFEVFRETSISKHLSGRGTMQVVTTSLKSSSCTLALWYLALPSPRCSSLSTLSMPIPPLKPSSGVTVDIVQGNFLTSKSFPSRNSHSQVDRLRMLDLHYYTLHSLS